MLDPLGLLRDMRGCVFVVAITLLIASIARIAQRLVDKYLFRMPNVPPIPDWKWRLVAGIVLLTIMTLLLFVFTRYWL